jgi:hypothetical protein
MAKEYTYQTFPFQGPPKFTQIGISGLKTNHLATLVMQPVRPVVGKFFFKVCLPTAENLLPSIDTIQLQSWQILYKFFFTRKSRHLLQRFTVPSLD